MTLTIDDHGSGWYAHTPEQREPNTLAFLGGFLEHETLLRDWPNTLTSDGVRQEARYIPSGTTEIFVTTTAPECSRPIALLLCASWGIEHHLLSALTAGLTGGMAGLGGMGVAFDYPGQGDSEGAPDATLDDMTRAAEDVVAATSTDADQRWIFAGLRFGAAIALLLTERIAPAGMLLVEPSLDPEAFLVDELRLSKRATLNDPDGRGLAFGFPVSQDLLANARERRPSVAVALSALECRTAAVMLSGGTDQPRFGSDVEVVQVPGRLRGRSRDHRGLLEASQQWLADVVQP